MYNFNASVISIETSTDGDGRFTATVKFDGMDHDDYTKEFRTAPNGTGLWVAQEHGEWKQILGTGEFRVSSRPQMRDKLRRTFN